MQKLNWDDFRVAHIVAKAGSLAKAAQVLQCNHTTVLRHINRLEEALNVKLFIRHQRGYKLTDAGYILSDTLPDIDAQFVALEDKLQSVQQDFSGKIRITTVTSYSSLLAPAMQAFRQQYPKVRIELLATDEVIPAQSGVVHVALRAGPKPQDPDLIVRHVVSLKMAYYASQSYVDALGLPESEAQMNEHQWLMPDKSKYHIPFIHQVIKRLSNESIVYSSNQFLDIQSAVISGMGIGPVSEIEANKHPDLIKLDSSTLFTTDYIGSLWYTYHKDLKENAKVKALCEFLIDHTRHLSV
ncbi:LysR family transcriptional regulator [Pseudoalteromonas luteoviolacea]|uniref:LysR family transcriptional regulator n=1 Tax=Pseudoalteromonas luteoviolacea TaxID=43657 RepID=UPI001B38AF72|nr:LysR family transcriptional regulator [Pseudoalteromonas luteoviolacea]MBQ4812550.1 LysR family transcriptional regulator [Pseudoalteromonas luteoviolacea]